MISVISADYDIADKWYDSDTFVMTIQNTGAQAVIPPRTNRKEMWEYDNVLHKDRNHVERYLQRFKHY